MKENNLALVSKNDLSKVEESALNAKQLDFLLTRTPKQYVKQRPAKGGGTWSYVSGGYVKKVLNLMFGFKWNFEIMDEMLLDTEVVVKGKLTVDTPTCIIVKMQYGNKDRIKRRDGGYLSTGNDMKAACTDCLKKCAAELGIAADIYNAEEFKEVKIAEAQPNYENLLGE